VTFRSETRLGKQGFDIVRKTEIGIWQHKVGRIGSLIFAGWNQQNGGNDEGNKYEGSSRNKDFVLVRSEIHG
jgi:hypothetical protein